jgi:hypothetical protein
MRFRRADRRPDGRLTAFQLFFFSLLPFLMGGGDTPEYFSSTHLPEAPGVVLWVFFSEGAWEADAARDVLELSPARLRFTSQWLRAISVEVDPEWVDELLHLPGVMGIRPVAGLPAVPLASSTLWVSENGSRVDWEQEPDGPRAPPPKDRAPQDVDSIYGELGEALEVLGIPKAHGLGFDGTGVRVGILDGTFRASHSALRSQPPLAVRDFLDQDGSVVPDPTDPPEAASHGTALWSLLAGNLPGTLRGSAPGVEVLLARIRGLGEVELADEDRWVAGLEWLEGQGARIVLSGVSFRTFESSEYSIDDLNGDGTPATRAADEAVRRGVLVVAPVGNGGPGLQTLEAPADGDSVLAAGAIDSRGIPTAFSAVGPTGDGREKPELFAPGLGIQAASGLGDQTLERVSGTEVSGALLAGAGALLVEAYPGRGPMEVLEILQGSTSPDTGAVVGVPKVASAIIFPQGVNALPVQEVTGEGEITNLSPQFQWTAPTLHPLGLPITFHIELAEDSLFRTLLTSDSVVGTFARRFPLPLPPRSRLFWRVRARSVQGVERTTEAQGPFLVPSWCSLEVLNDPSGSELVDPQPLFRWSSPQLLPPIEPLTFELQVVSDRETEIIQSYPGLEEKEFRIPTPLPFNVPLRWRVIARGGGGGADTVTSAGPFVVTSGANPPATILYQNFPNPFPNPEVGLESTRIWFDLAEATTVELAVFDLRGRLVRQLVPGRGCPAAELPPGLYGREGGATGDPCHTYSWDGKDDRDREVPPGVYLLRLKAGGVVEIRRIVFWP